MGYAIFLPLNLTGSTNQHFSLGQGTFHPYNDSGTGSSFLLPGLHCKQTLFPLGSCCVFSQALPSPIIDRKRYSVPD